MAEGNREEEDRLGTAPLQPGAFHAVHGLHGAHHSQHPQPPLQQIYSPHQHYDFAAESAFHSPIASFDPHPTQPAVASAVIASYAAANLQAVAANAAAATAAAPRDPFANSVDPDDFYRDYRAVQPQPGSPPQPGLMASTTLPHPHNPHSLSPPQPHSQADPHTLPRQVAASIRLDNHGNLGAARLPHPAMATGHSGLRPGFRSASSPVDDRSSRQGSATGNKYGPTKQPSVKDLKKRFDQTASTASEPLPAVRKPGLRNPAKDGLSSTSHSKPAGSSPGHAASSSASSYTTLRSSTSRDPGSDTHRGGPSNKATQRQKFVYEDQLSNNSQSFASRVRAPKPANQSSTAKAHPPKAATQLPDRSPPPQNTASFSPAGTRQTGLLFGEILPQESGSHTVGFGIDGTRPRRTSESQIHSPTSLDRNVPTTGEGDASSPTDWYRGVASTRDVRPPPARGGSKIPQSTHSRAHSDVVPSKPALTILRPGSRQTVTNSPTSQPTSPCRLPVSVKKLSMSSNPSSPSSRSNSPSSVQPFPPSGRSSRQHNLPARRAKTPTTASSTNPPNSNRARTPTTAHSTLSNRKAAPSKIATPASSSNTRLAAYISAPPPKLSPPLRSSRPRQPVSTASTASSRMKAVERAQTNKSVPKDSESSKRPKISVGPIDFAQRRETIKLAYSKSIRESQAREARQAALRRKKEQETAAKAQAAAEAEAKAIAEAVEAAEAAEAATAAKAAKAAEAVEAAGPSEHPVIETGTDIGVATPQDAVAPQLKISTAAPALIKSTTDSPTLGIPGSFPSFQSSPPDADDVPLSAVSNASAVTEFDADPQTEAPVPERVAAVANGVGLGIQNSVDPIPAPAHEKATYRSPFDEPGTNEDDQVSIRISLEASPLQRSTEKPTPTADGFVERGGESHIPGSFDGNLDSPEVDVSAQSSQESHERQVEHATVPLVERLDPGTEPPANELQEAHDHAPELEYEPRPFLPLSQATTVTILGHESDFRPPDYVAPKPPKPLAEHHLRRSVEHIRDEKTPVAEPHMDSLEDFYVGPHVGDNVAVLRDSPGLSSEFSDDQGSYAESQRTPDPAQTLAIPGLLSPANRTSQHSAWTDFSIDSSDGGRDRISKQSVIISRDSTLRGRPPILPASSRPESFADECSRDGDDLDYRRRDVRSDEHLSRSSCSESSRLLEVDTGAGFSMDYLEGAMATKPSAAVPLRPDHEPPPVPTPDNRSIREGRRTPSSGYYDQTRPSSYFQSSKDDESTFSVGPSRRESDDYTHTVLTPKSTDQTSLDSVGIPFSRASTIDVDHKLSVSDEAREVSGTDRQSVTGKEKSRLTQRQNVIKELIDTEAVFVRDMSVVEEIYKGTAEACPRLDTKTVKLIFRNTDEIIAFHNVFLTELKESVLAVYAPKGRRSPFGKDSREDSVISDSMTIHSTGSGKEPKEPAASEPDDAKDRQTSIGPVFSKHIDQMRLVHEGFLRTSDLAAKRLIQIQEDKTVKVWLDECNEVAKDLTAAWNLDSLLIKPMQRITKYPNLISQLLQYTPENHPDREALISARATLENAILDINKTKKNFELVGQIVGRKRKESDVRAGFARAFGKRVDRLQPSGNRPAEDADYQRLKEKFGDDYLRLQVVLRDVEFYTRQVSAYVHEFLQYLSAMELVMRLQPSPFPVIESKWARFNVSMRDMEKVALDQHLAQVRKHVIEPFELVIRCYSNPSLAMKKREKRRLDFEKAEQLRKGGKKVDKQLGELVEHYDALNETLKKELPQLSAHTERIGNICLGNFVCIQVKWFSIWKEKVKVVLEDAHVPEFAEVAAVFQREFREMEEQIGNIGILNPSMKPRSSQSTADETMSRTRSRPADLSPRGRGLSVNSDAAPSLPTPEFVRTNSGHFNLSPTTTAAASTSPHHYYYRDQYSGLNVNGHSTSNSRSGPGAVPGPGGSGSPGGGSGRPSTGRSYDSSWLAPRPSVDSNGPHTSGHVRRDSSTANQPNIAPPAQDTRRFSGLFHSALPVSDEQDEQRQARSRSQSQRPSRASSRERLPATTNGYNVMWLAASLFEFNIEDTKHEAGYPYLTYQAGEIFDVIAEKGELWLAKNQDDPSSLVGWIWSKHFAKLADS